MVVASIECFRITQFILTHLLIHDLGSIEKRHIIIINIVFKRKQVTTRTTTGHLRAQTTIPQHSAPLPTVSPASFSVKITPLRTAHYTALCKARKDYPKIDDSRNARVPAGYRRENFLFLFLLY